MGRPELVDQEKKFADKLIERRRGGYCYEHNTLLWAVLEALGFQHEGTRRRRMFRRYDRTWHDEDVMGLLRSDWRGDADG